MTLTYKELEKWFEDLRKIIFDINVSINNINRITSSRNDYESQILKHGFFSHFYRQSRFTVIVQLCKIFANNDNQKLNINKLFNRLINDKYDKEIKEYFTKNQSNKFNELMSKNFEIEKLFCSKAELIQTVKYLQKKIAENNLLITKVVELRDKYYAHSDPAADIPAVNDLELESLAKLAIETYNLIRGKLIDTHFSFETSSGWSIDYPIKTLALYRKMQFDELNKLKEKK